MYRSNKSETYIKKFFSSHLLKLDKIFVIILVLICCFTCVIKIDYRQNLFEDINLSNPYKFIGLKDNGHMIIDQAKTRVLRMDTNNKVNLILNANDDTFLCAEDIVDSSSDEGFFIYDVKWNNGGFSIMQESIYKYDAFGRRYDTVYRRSYKEEQSPDIHTLHGIKNVNGYIFLAKVESEGIRVIRVSNNVETEIRYIKYHNAIEFIQDLCICKDEVCFIDRRGYILKSDHDYFNEMYRIPKGSLVTPNKIKSDAENNVYFNDLFTSNVYKINLTQKSLTTIFDQEKSFNAPTHIQDNIVYGLSVFKNLSDTDFNIDLTTGNNVLEVNKDGDVTFNSRNLEKSTLWIVWLSIILILNIVKYILIIWLIIRIAIILYPKAKSLSLIKKVLYITMGSIVFSSCIVSNQIIGYFKGIYVDQITNELYKNCSSVQNIIDIDLLERIDSSDDFMNEDYILLTNQLNNLIDKSGGGNFHDTYSLMTKRKDDFIYYMYSLNNYIGGFFPLTPDEAKEILPLYQSNQDCTKVNQSMKSTFNSLYAIIPLKGPSGNVVATLEIGRDCHFLDKQINNVMHEIIIAIALLIIIVLFSVNEGGGIIESLKKLRCSKKSSMLNQGFIRPVTLFGYIFYNMSTSFLSMYIMNVHVNKSSIPQFIIQGLPMTMNLMLFGASNVICPTIIKKMGFLKSITSGAILSCIGQFILFTTNNYYMLVLGLMLDGVGCGITLNSLSVFISLDKNYERQTKNLSMTNSSSLSGVIIGSVVGSYIAKCLGQSFTFLITSIGWCVVACIIVIFITRNRTQLNNNKLGSYSDFKKEEKARIGVPLNMIIYILFQVIPYALIETSLYYLIPIIGEGFSLNEAEISLILVIYSLGSVLLGSIAINLMISKFEKDSLKISSFMCIIAILIFGYYNTLVSLIICVAILGIVASFGGTLRIQYFLRIKRPKGYTSERSIAVYNLFKSVFASVGPILSSLLITNNMFSGILIFSVFMLFCIISNMIFERLGVIKYE